MNNFPFHYELPADRIAQSPCEPRDHARLLVLERQNQTLQHRRFHELPHLLMAGDLLVLNDTKVVNARLIGKRAKTGGKWEGLFLRELPDASWEILCQTRGTLQPGEKIEVEAGLFDLQLIERRPDGRWRVRPSRSGPVADLLDHFGRVPLPPYIRKGEASEEDRCRYQTIYAKQAGAVAAPTAGLHFTQELFEQLHACGIAWTYVTLHVGLGTFQPIQVEDYTQHPMHWEWGQLSHTAALAIQACKSRGGRVIAVGTTTVRVLESAAQQDGLQGWSGETNLYIYPPYDFKMVDALITNFHLPRTTLLLLVAALTGNDLLHQAYRTAIAENYRFYSYGDAMLIV